MSFSRVTVWTPDALLVFSRKFISPLLSFAYLCKSFHLLLRFPPLSSIASVSPLLFSFILSSTSQSLKTGDLALSQLFPSLLLAAPSPSSTVSPPRTFIFVHIYSEKTGYSCRWRRSFPLFFAPGARCSIVVLSVQNVREPSLATLK